MAYEINKIEKVDLFNGVDLVKVARLSVERLHKIREELTTEKLEKYDKNRNKWIARSYLSCSSYLISFTLRNMSIYVKIYL